MQKNLTLFWIYLVIILGTCSLHGQSIREKKLHLEKRGSDLSTSLHQELTQYNLERRRLREHIKKLYDLGWQLYADNEEGRESFEEILEELTEYKEALASLETSWQYLASSEGTEDYALWHQPDTTVEQLVIDYGSLDYVYLIPKEIGSLPLSMSSHFPVPRSSWTEMLELILSQIGVGVHQVNPYLRKLSLVEKDRSLLKGIALKQEELLLFDPSDRVGLLLQPDITLLRQQKSLLEKFANPNSQTVELIGRQLFIFSTAKELIELMKVFDFCEGVGGEKEFQLVSLCKFSAQEMVKMLSALFDVEQEENKPLFSEPGSLRITLLENRQRALFLAGQKKDVDRAIQMIENLECQACDVREKELFWYTCKYSDPEEVAQVLEKVYNLMVCNYQCSENPQADCSPACGAECTPCYPEPRQCTSNELYQESFYQQGDVVVNPAPVELSSPKEKVKDPCRQNFIVDPKTGSLVMVVERDLLGRIQETLHRLDVPKKMVQIEVLLFEKKTSDRNQFRLDLFRMGQPASNTHKTGLVWNDLAASILNKGIFEFFISRPKTGWFPAFDIDYKFLLSQEDIQINAAPSVLTINQTEAKIAIVDEISINTGVYDVETAHQTTLKDAFTRSQYGINLAITPTIHLTDEATGPQGETTNYITLETKVNFDTIQPGSQKDRPDVTRREITNEAVIADGQSVILGGLRRKNAANFVDKIPFLGDIPCLGKLFSTTDYTDHSTEMFIMITPKIIKDPKEELHWIRCEEMKRRPGDLPEYLCRLSRALRCERERVFEGTFNLLFGHRYDRCYAPGWQDDTHCP